MLLDILSTSSLVELKTLDRRDGYTPSNAPQFRLHVIYEGSLSAADFVPDHRRLRRGGGDRNADSVAAITVLGDQRVLCRSYVESNPPAQ